MDCSVVDLPDGVYYVKIKNWKVQGKVLDTCAEKSSSYWHIIGDDYMYESEDVVEVYGLVKKKVESMLKNGDVIEIPIGCCVNAVVPEHFLYENKKGCFDKGYGAVKVDGELSFIKGQYVVVKTEMSGGSSTSDLPRDQGYPDCSRVYCESVRDRTIEIDFYQEGNYGPSIEGLKPVGKARLMWVVDDV